MQIWKGTSSWIHRIRIQGLSNMRKIKTAACHIYLEKIRLLMIFQITMSLILKDRMEAQNLKMNPLESLNTRAEMISKTR
jgi:hypothetical protein